MPALTLHAAAAGTVHHRAAAVAAFVATPDHWPAFHPRSAAVLGGRTGRPLRTGDMVREEIVGDGGARFFADWLVTAHDPGRTFAVRSVGFGGRAVQLAVTYTFEENGDGSTLVRRAMTTTVAPYEPLGGAERAAYGSGEHQAAFLPGLRAALAAAE
ncbi:SRPBCC family protein [Streptomyces sp. NPDC047002]|uniref:SRPBCC family protein n=1 Tax=Streptomyces sp. NPDC047002 TaxID=3155475 RepID=UPI0034544D6F